MDASLLRAVDAVETDAFRVLGVEDFDGVAVEDGNEGAGEVGGTDKSGDEHSCQQRELYPVRDHGSRKVAINDHRVPRR